MKHPFPIALALALPVVLSSCGLANRIMQPPMRLMQAGARTLSTDAGDTTPPATREANEQFGIALDVTETR